MKVYLLDTNIWSDWYRNLEYALNGIAKLRGKEHKLMMSPVSWGEFAYGWNLEKTYRKEEFLAFINSINFQFCKYIDKHTASIYGELRALLTEKYDPNRKKTKWIDALEDPTTSQRLGVQENDLWITCHAINLGVTLVTADTKIDRLLEIIPQKYIGNKKEGFCYQIWDQKP
jgi:predicted nucleic acid-binding protein